MKFQRESTTKPAMKSVWGLVFGIALAVIASPTFAAIPWDGEGNDGIWFNPMNWNRNMNNNITLPPGDATAGATDTEISAGTASLNGGQGVIYNPTAGPGTFFPPSGSVLPAPTGFSYQKIRELYMSRASAGQATVTPDNTLTIMGDLEATATVIVGRSSGNNSIATNARINQLAGTVKVNIHALDLGNREGGTRAGYGNGTYDYRGGRLEVSLESPDFGGHGIRLSSGGSAGTGGVGTFIMHNPTTPGYVRTLNFKVASDDGVAGNAAVSPNGSTLGVGVVQFHYENGGTRPIQVSRNLDINNGVFDQGTRSARLDLALSEAPCSGDACIPDTLGLFDVDFEFDPFNSGLFAGVRAGEGDLGQFFSSANGSTLYTEGSTVSATFGSTQYNWSITYAGNITWANQADADNGVVASISGSGGNDVVLVGLSSVSMGLEGDYNEDGTVDAADYVVWRRTDGSPSGYDTWRANFGMSSPGGGSGSSAGVVPEPTTMVFAFGCVIATWLVGSRSYRHE